MNTKNNNNETTEFESEPAKSLIAEYQEAILKLVKSDSYTPMRTKEISRHLGLPKHARTNFQEAIKDLKRRHKIMKVRGSKWVLPDQGEHISGTLRVTRSGCGFLIPDDSSKDDVFIGEENLLNALDGDKVLISIDSPKGKGFRHYGTVQEIIERASPRFVAIITQEMTAEPEDIRNPYTYIIEEPPKDLKPETKVIFETTIYPDNIENPRGKVIEVLGPAGAPDTEIAAILASFNAPGDFPEEVKDEVYRLGDSNPFADKSNRLDLTEDITVTIDPETARDFDDALSITKNKDGTYKVGIHIADVSHFVRPAGIIDEEARSRSTSIYLPGRVIPMLPEELSNDLCSLRPQEERFTKSVFIDYSPEGEVLDYKIYRSVIKSTRRMTYPEVKHLLSDEDAGKAFEEKEILEVLVNLNELAQVLRHNRVEKGSLELNMAEYVIIFNENDEVIGMDPVEHDFSHQLVEEFMLAANISVARWCHENGLPVLHRIHESPTDEALEELAEFLTSSGYPFKPPLRRDRLQAILNTVKGKPEEHSINLSILKSFKQAVYGPDSNIGHFALNFPHYLHFTSPIRRYPDLYLHQALDAVFDAKGNKLPKKTHRHLETDIKDLIQLGIHTSGMERRAMKIEEGVKDFRKLELLQKSSEKDFDAVVTGIRKFGIFVEIKDYFVEGLLPRKMVENMGYSTKEVVPSRGKKNSNPERGFHLGQLVRVKVTKIDLSARSCQLRLMKVIN